MQELPEKFVSLHGASLSSSVRLKTHSGLEWKVKVVKGRRRIWLHKGWPDFEKHYRLEFEHMVCFRYIPNSAFEVSIFDRSTCEIHHFGRSRLSFADWSKKNVPKARRARMIIRGTKAYDDSASFESPYPFFRVVIKRSCHYSNVPNPFGEEYLTRGYQTVKLVRNGRSWHVRLCFGLVSGYQFTAGFVKFVRENDLVPGDICMFELVQQSNVVLKVTCFLNPR